ncbi:MAG: ArsR/SmtB family transcription factor [Roseburia sp.]
MKEPQEVIALAKEFEACQKILIALGDETRQHLILEMMKIGDCNGARVGDITERTNLSRPAVSHHLQIMKDAGIVKVRKEATKNYYYFDPDMEAFEKLSYMLQHAMEITKSLPDRSGEND